MKTARKFIALAFWAIGLAMLTFATGEYSAYQRPGRTERVSVSSDGDEVTGFGDFISDYPHISADGRYVVFDSIATNLVPNDTNGFSDAFLHDHVTGKTTQVSVSPDGVAGNQATFAQGISGDGRYVVMESYASNFVPNDESGRDVFVRDNVTGEMTMVSKPVGGGSANNDSFGGAISRDGRFVAFESDASNLVPNDTNGASDVFVFDRQSGTLSLVSMDGAGNQSNAFSGYPSLSADGRYVTFNSRGTNMPGNPTGLYQVYRRDRVTGEVVLVSVPAGGGSANGSSFGGHISLDGNLVAFDSDASNLVPQDDNSASDVFVRDIAKATTVRVSVDSAGVEGNGFSSFGRISGDGRIVTFQSDTTNLMPNDTNNGRDIFAHNLESGATEFVSTASDGSLSIFPPPPPDFINQEVWHPAISDDARFITYDSTASNMVPNDSNGGSDIFVRDRGPDLGIGQLTVNSAGGQLNVSGWATFPAMKISEASDPNNDGSADADSHGGQITHVAATYRPEQADLFFAFKLNSLPASPTNGIPCTGVAGCPPGGVVSGTIYGFQFNIAGSKYEVRGQLTAFDVTTTAVPVFALYNCDSSCNQVAELTGSAGSTGNQVLISLPLTTLNAGPTPELSSLHAYSAIGDAATGPLSILDDVDLADGSVPARQVLLGIAPNDTPLGSVLFDRIATLSGGNFTASIDQSAFPAGSAIWAKACLGNNCGSAMSWPALLKITRLTKSLSSHGIIAGEATPLGSVDIQASPDLVAPFVTIGSVTANANGAFEFEDADAAGMSKRFYRAVYP